MRFVSFTDIHGTGLAVRTHHGDYRGLHSGESGFPGTLGELLARGPEFLTRAAEILGRSQPIDSSAMAYSPPLAGSAKILCIGLNYVDHSMESGFTPPEYPTVFARFNSSLIGHLAPILRPRISQQLDYEGEVAAIVGKGGRNISRSSALKHIAGYSLFNDASIRDYQFKSTQWTIGKNFDSTGAFGPEFVSADELPPGCKGLRFQTSLNEQVVQTGSIDDLIFDVASLVATLSEAMTLSPGDIIVTGTPGGVGLARTPPLWMKPGDICTISCNELGKLQNPVVDGA